MPCCDRQVGVVWAEMRSLFADHGAVVRGIPPEELEDWGGSYPEKPTPGWIQDACQDHSDKEIFIANVHRYGWPIRWLSVEYCTGDTWVLLTGVWFRAGRIAGLTFPVILPTGVSLAPLAANTIIYSTAIACLVGTGRVLVVWYRLKVVVPRRLGRRQCPACKYEIGGQPFEADENATCPECGAAWSNAETPMRPRPKIAGGNIRPR